MGRSRGPTSFGWCALLTFAFAGCMLVAPLDDLPAPRDPQNDGGKAPIAGSSQAGAEDGGEPTSAGSPGSAGTSGTGGKPPDDGPCQTNAECMLRFGQEPARCRPSDNKCVPLKNDVCPLAYGYPEDPNAIFFGAFTTFNPSALEDNSIAWAYRLALEELSGDLGGGLPDGPDGKSRRLAMVLCSNVSRDVAPAMQHLVEEVQVPAVVAMLRPGDLRRAFEAHRSSDVLYLSPVTVSQTLDDLDDSGMIWNLLGKPADMAPAYGPLLTLTESFVRNERELAEEIPLRVALVTSQEAFDAELGEAVPEFLEFNGKTVLENGADYRGFEIDTADPKLGELAAELITFRPHVIVSTASELLSRPKGLFEIVETDWGVHGTPAERAFRPQWILSPFNAGDLSDVQGLMEDLIEGSGEAMERRVVGISIAGAVDTTLQNSYATRLRTKFSKAYTDSANYYDAVYYLAYGMYASGVEEEPTGPGIAEGLKRLLEGKAFNVGPKQIGAIFQELSSPSGSISLASTLGPPTFDATSGVRSVQSSVFCFDPADGLQLRVDVLRYDEQTQQLTGEDFPCFTGFYP
jgi:hypothetical protein